MSVREERLAEFLAAKTRYHEAKRVMTRASRTYFQLLRHGVEENRAHTLAGMSLADQRCRRTCQHMRRAFARLNSSCRSTAMRLWAKGAWCCVYLPRAANDPDRR
jgi:hypothetical protein